MGALFAILLLQLQVYPASVIFLLKVRVEEAISEEMSVLIKPWIRMLGSKQNRVASVFYRVQDYTLIPSDRFSFQSHFHLSLPLSLWSSLVVEGFEIFA